MRTLSLLLMVFVASSSTSQTKLKLTFDEFFDYTTLALLSFSSNDQYLLFQTTQPSWNTSSYENTLWLYDIQRQTRKLITKNLHKLVKPQWSPSGQWLAFLLDETSSNATKFNRYRRSSDDSLLKEQYIYLYSPASNESFPVSIGTVFPLDLTWSDTDLSFYLAAVDLQRTENDEEGWRDVRQYRESKKQEESTIYRISIVQNNSSLSIERDIVLNVSFSIGSLLYVPIIEKLLCTFFSLPVESFEDFELYSINLQDTSSLTKLIDNEMLEGAFQITKDGQNLLFLSGALGSISEKYNSTQTRLYSMNLINGQITRLMEKFNGCITAYTTTSDGSVYILGQLGTETQIYSQRTSSDEVIPWIGWNGTYASILASSQNLIALVHSSTEQPMEIYLVNNINQLESARAITNENKLFTERDLPRTKVYQWINQDDHQTIEGILHYPPGKFEAKNLPLLVLIHGGPYAASVNRFLPDWYTWAPLAASKGWLVLEPNYRGSTGYGDQFLNQIRYRPVSLPGKDILYGVDQLIRDGIVDPHRLTVGGYSYGGFLTNWLITQTKRFNAALSGAGVIDHTSAWGAMDIPVLLSHIFGGYPWEVPHIYQNEAPIYQLDRVRTPTLIATGENDIRVPTDQSYIMERGLYYRGVPVKLISFPNEGHLLAYDPWHGKIKVREELKWLQKYGNQSSY